MSGHDSALLEQPVNHPAARVHALQAPSGNGEVLAFPSLDQAETILDRNRVALATANISLLGRPLAEIIPLVRKEVLEQTREYYGESGESFPTLRAGPFLVAGHQPELFHPGVWLKNFTLNRLAQKLGGTAINLVVDNDTARGPQISLPFGGRLKRIPLDEKDREVPFEEREVANEVVFRDLPERVREVSRSWPFRPLLPEFWSDVQAQEPFTRNLAERLVRARRAWERRWGLEPLELPVSRLCRTEGFAAFVGHLWKNAGHLREAYNRGAADYRRRYGLRSQNHPVPDLARDADWIEVPFWGWEKDYPQRGRLFVRSSPRGLELRCGSRTWPSLGNNTPESLLEAVRALEPAGFKVRPRALSLTLFCRLCLGDLFLHGLGGGKYDEVTDSLVRDFFDAHPPGYFVVTGTLRLPFPLHQANTEDERRLRWRLRDLTFNPQRHLRSRKSLTPADGELLFRKAVLMRVEPLRHRDRADRFFQFRRMNEDLAPLVAQQKAIARREERDLTRLLRENEVVQRRDYPFCLYPQDELRAFLSGNE